MWGLTCPLWARDVLDHDEHWVCSLVCQLFVGEVLDHAKHQAWGLFWILESFSCSDNLPFYLSSKLIQILLFSRPRFPCLLDNVCLTRVSAHPWHDILYLFKLSFWSIISWFALEITCILLVFSKDAVADNVITSMLSVRIHVHL